MSPAAGGGQTLAFLQHRWKNLLGWLENHGFQAQDLSVECREAVHGAGNGLFSRSSCLPESLVLAVPPKALMNKTTLKRLYPPDARVVKSLTAVQLISMHLFIWRPKLDEDSADPSFGPYISILPRDFSGHPLTWLVLSNLDKADDVHTLLLNSLPPSVLAALHDLHARFSDDWNKVRTFLRMPLMATIAQVSSNDLESFDATINFLWAWLNVNTRCIYYRLEHAETDPDNLTMGPILDFANHTLRQPSLIPVPSNIETWNAAPMNSIGDGLKFISSSDVKIEEDDEILITYGMHSNKTLFVEYGFVNLLYEKDNGEVDVQDLTEKYVFTDARLGDAVKTALVTEGYWGDWTLYCTPDGAEPSWRLITALRLHYFVEAAGSADEDIIQSWRDVVIGKRSQISRENEQSWRKAVEFLCDLLIERAEQSVALPSALDKNGEHTWMRWMSENIGSLWREELLVARAVKESLMRGDEY